MNRVLAFLFFMLFLSAFALIMLNDMRDIRSAQEEDSADQTVHTIISGDWRPVSQTATGPQAPFINFARDGTIYGFGGCNSFSGHYVATDTTLDIEPLKLSRKACPEPVMQREVSFIREVESAKSYNIDGTTLILGSINDTHLQLGLVTRGDSP